ncbi:FkbM family methyltransferase [Roseovarius sp. B08]|uniref:FkbM family methyltransferase n=1 Tax=Roseovarius sp. B08 TaxID=3449223 RepID=UPI003EDB734D
MQDTRELTFSSPGARLQYSLLMALFRLAVSRGLYGRFARGLGRIFNRDNQVFLRIDGAPPFGISLDDGYWTRFALWHEEYEPEVAAVLGAASGQAKVFCDCGANKGYWTVRAAALFDRVIAAEAAQATFAALEGNAGRLPNVTLHQVAIHSVSGKHLTFVNVANSHASARLLSDGKPGPGDKTETVVTRRIDDLVPKGVPALIKLDVEGAEVEALKGASRALQEGAVIIYEDHGSDPTCAPSSHLLSIPETCLFFCDDRFSQVTSLDQVRALKTDPYKGYNLLAAHRDSALLARILERL